MNLERPKGYKKRSQGGSRSWPCAKPPSQKEEERDAMSAVDSAKQTLSAGTRTVKRVARNTSNFVSELTLKQA